MDTSPESAVALAVYAVVRSIPSGRVATYGQVAELVEEYTVSARAVGQIMAFCPPDVPWHRVVGARGTLPIHRRDPGMAREQRRRLEAEGVEFESDGRIRIAAFQLEVEDLEAQGLFALADETTGETDS
jgi:methylated-DNA-protein-cysteine methyltransferase-like protein